MTKAELVEDVRIGDVIKIRTDKEEVVGTVDDISETSLKIIRSDTNMIKRIGYDIILDYEVGISLGHFKKKDNSEEINKNENKKLEGIIDVFNASKRIGKIKTSNGELLFFHISQVKDIKLQKELLCGLGINEKVNYVIGKNYEGKAASEIEREEDLFKKTGFICDFDIVRGNIYGQIKSDNVRYVFRIPNVISPFVKAAIRENLWKKRPLEVLFSVFSLRGRKIAVAIEEKYPFDNNLISDWKENKSITEADLYKWGKRKKIDLIDVDTVKYNALPLYSDVEELGIENKIETSIDNKNLKNRNTKNEEQVYFEKARKAELIEKDLHKAISLYREAINNNQRLSASVPNLVSIYIRLELFDEAMELLDNEGKRYMESTKYLNLRLAVLQASKDPKRKKDIQETFIQVIAITTSKEKKADLILLEANLMSQIGEYKISIDLYNHCLKDIDNHVYILPEKNERQKIAIWVGLCNAYIKLGEIDNAKIYAEYILNSNPENEFAKSIVTGKMLDGNIEFDDWVGVSKFSDFIVDRINRLNLENELKNKTSIKDGLFIGTENEAKKIIEGIKRNQITTSVNDEIQSNNYFAVAKIIRQIVDRDETINDIKSFCEKNYQLNVATGCYFYGNYRLYRTEFSNNFDTARYCFFETISIFKDSEKKHKCWSAATIRYLDTLFCDNKKIKDDAKIFYTIKDIDGALEDKISKLMGNNILIPITEFVISIIELLTYNHDIKNIVISNLYNNQNINYITNVLNKLCDLNVNNCYSKEQFVELWNRASSSYYTKRKHFYRVLKDTIEASFVYGQLRENYNKFIENEFIEYLCPTDKDYVVEDLRLIFETLLKYNEGSEFDYKSDALAKTDEIRRRLEEKILDSPTFISYEKLLPLLNQLQARIFKESAQLFGNSKPEISVNLSGGCAIDKENLIVRAPLEYKNGNNVQNADNVSIVIKGDKVEVINDGQLSRGFLAGNGLGQAEMVEFKVSPEIIEKQAFDININISYQYKKNMTEIEDANVEIELPIPLYSSLSFKKIQNKFEPYRNGSEVKDVEMFYGRDKDIESIIREICDESGRVFNGRCLALYGQTRTGKSSLLYHLENKLREIDAEKNIIVNIGSIGEENLSGNDISDFLYTLLDELKHEITTRHNELNNIINEYGIEIEPDKIIDNPEHSQLYFNDTFKKINRLFHDELLNYNIIIMIDEFTYIYDWINRGIMTDRFMKFWKAFIQNNGVFAIVIGQDHMMKFVNEKQFTNDFGSTDLRKVTYLSEEDAKRLMYEPIMIVKENGEKENRYHQEALDRLYELTAGSAFLIMNLCAGLVDYLNETHTVYITKAHVDDYLKKNICSFEESRFFEPQYDDKSNVNNDEKNMENKRILYKIARLSNKREWTPLSYIIKSDDDKRIVESLEQRDVIIISEREKCKIKVTLYKEWIIAKYGLEANNE